MKTNMINNDSEKLRDNLKELLLSYGIDHFRAEYLCKEILDLLLDPKTNSETYTAYLYEDDCMFVEDESVYDDMYEAISFALERNWNEVVNDKTGEIVWSNNNI